MDRSPLRALTHFLYAFVPHNTAVEMDRSPLRALTHNDGSFLSVFNAVEMDRSPLRALTQVVSFLFALLTISRNG